MTLRILLTAAALLASPLAFAGEPPPAYHVVYLDDSRPVLIRLNIEIDGKPLAVVWQHFLDFVFASADADKNGTLDKSEAERVPTPQTIFGNAQFLIVDAVAVPAAVGNMLNAMDRNRDGKVTPSELETYYRNARATAFNLQFGGVDRLMQRRLIASGRGPRPSTDTLNEALFKTLDTDGNGKLSRAELVAAPGLLDRLDADEDEVLTSEEVVQQPPAASGYEQVVFLDSMEAQPTNSPFIAVTPGEPASNLAKQLLARYARGEKVKAKRVTREDLGLQEKAFAALDVDEDGTLDPEELARFADSEPDVEVNVRLGRTRKPLAIEVTRPAPNSPMGPHDPINVEIGNTRLNLRVVLPGSDGPNDTVRQRYRMQFTNADGDANGYLDAKEVESNRFFRSTFKAMDEDGDGMLFLKEMLTYLDRQEAVRGKAIASCVTLNISDQGKGILDLLDTSKDGRLGLRELRQVVNLLKELDRDGDGSVVRTEMPRSYTLSATRGTSVPGNSGGVFVVQATGMGDPERPPAPTAGPLWFRKMDRNRDGDVSRREFLGTDADFSTMDADNDGLISLSEAEKVDAEHRTRTSDRP